jgi:hypothetical protein
LTARVSATAEGARSASNTIAAAPGFRVVRMSGVGLMDFAWIRLM